MGPEDNVGLGECQIMECLLPYFNMVTVPHKTVGLERMSNYRGVGIERFHCTSMAYIIREVINLGFQSYNKILEDSPVVFASNKSSEGRFFIINACTQYYTHSETCLVHIPQREDKISTSYKGYLIRILP